MWELSRARRHHRRALRLRSAGLLAAGQEQAGRAVALFTQHHHRSPGSASRELASALVDLGEFHAECAAHASAEPLYQQAAALLKAAGDTEPLVVVLIRLGNGQRLRGEFRHAEETLREAIAMLEESAPGPGWAGLLGAAHNALGIVCKDTGRYGDAARLYASARELCRDAGPGLLADVHHNVAGLAHVQGRFAEAEEPARQALALREQAGDPDSIEVAADAAVLGAVLAGLQRYDEAKELLRRALGSWRTRFGPEHYEVAVNLHNLAALHQQCGEPVEALRDFRAALRIKESVLGEHHPEVGAILNNLAVLHADQGRGVDAARCYDRAVTILVSSLGEDHPSTAQCRANYLALRQEMSPPATRATDGRSGRSNISPGATDDSAGTPPGPYLG